MAQIQVVCVEWVDGTIRRATKGLAWLKVSPKNDEYRAKEVFENAGDGAQTDLMNRFQFWLDGFHHKKYFHRWDENEYKDVFIFKHQESRFFGFLCHPDPFNKRLEVCVLASYVEKTEWEADNREKNKMTALRDNLLVRKALADIKDNCEERR